MLKEKRYRMEFRSLTYNTIGDLIIDWETKVNNMQRSFFDSILEKTDKRLYDQYVDGCTIFHLTERQYKKFLALIKK